MLYAEVSKNVLPKVTNIVPPRRPIRRRRVKNISPTRPRISPTRPKNFADASIIFRRHIQGFRRGVQRFHRRRGNAADANSYHIGHVLLVGNLHMSCVHVCVCVCVNKCFSRVFGCVRKTAKTNQNRQNL